jgi:hypothetical protein
MEAYSRSYQANPWGKLEFWILGLLYVTIPLKQYLENFASLQQESMRYELCLRFLVESLEQRQVGECLEGEVMYEYIVLRRAGLDLRVYQLVYC